MNQETRKKLIENLPDNWLELLAAQFRFSKSHLRNIVYGFRNNEDVLKAAVSIAEEAVQQKILREQTINSFPNAS